MSELGLVRIYSKGAQFGRQPFGAFSFLVSALDAFPSLHEGSPVRIPDLQSFVFQMDTDAQPGTPPAVQL